MYMCANLPLYVGGHKMNLAAPTIPTKTIWCSWYLKVPCDHRQTIIQLKSLLYINVYKEYSEDCLEKHL